MISLFLAAILASPPEARWGEQGHRIVCEIAWQRLTPAARELVRGIRSADPDSGATFAESCLWADRVRETTHQHTSSYHYINIPPGVAGADFARDCGDSGRGCNPWAIEHFSAVIADRRASPVERAEALKFVSHFVGDLHQPLHAGRPADLGGNRIRVFFFPPDVPSGRAGAAGAGGARGGRGNVTLHAVWDTELIGRGGLAWPASALALNAEITAEEAAEWVRSGPMEWTNESYRAAEEVVYVLPAGNRIDDAYYERGLALSRDRLKRAGTRLAHLLNEIAAKLTDVDPNWPAGRDPGSNGLGSRPILLFDTMDDCNSA